MGAKSKGVYRRMTIPLSPYKSILCHDVCDGNDGPSFKQCKNLDVKAIFKESRNGEKG
jgi:hypothetical protein